jgi:hypothetical protein
MELHVGILNTAQLMMITDIFFFVRLLPVASLFGGIVDINLDVFNLLNHQEAKLY